MTRVQMAIYHANAASEATLYATFGNCPDPIGNGPSIGGLCTPSLYKSTDAGASWTLQQSSLPSAYSRYTHGIAIHPTDPTQVLVAGFHSVPVHQFLAINGPRDRGFAGYKAVSSPCITWVAGHKKSRASLR